MDNEWWEWNSDLAKDIHCTLKNKECSLLQIKGHSRLLYWRRYLVDWIALTCQKYMLNSNTQHLAVCLFDRFIDQFDLGPDDVQLLVLCCLILASKFEEREDKIPKFITLMQQLHWKLDKQLKSELYFREKNLDKIKSQVSESVKMLAISSYNDRMPHLKPSEYLQMEIRILSAFRWQVGFPTASHFKEYYMQVLLSSQDVMAGRPISGRQEILIYLEKNINYFLEVSLQDRAFLVFKPSLVTASCIAAARICLRIAPTWTTELQQTTHFFWHQLIPCIEILLRLYDEDRKATHHKRDRDSAGGGSVQFPEAPISPGEPHFDNRHSRSLVEYLV